MLTQTQIDRFYEDGFCLVEEILDAEDLAPVIAAVEEAVADGARSLTARGALSSGYEQEGFETRLSRITAETEALYWSICSGQVASAGIFSLIANPKLLDLAESLVGPEIMASSVYRLRPKIPGFPHGVVPWHQDSGYFEPHCDRDLVLTMWIPLVDATPERGCLQLVRGVHRGPLATHHRNPSRRYLEILPGDLPCGEVVTVPVRRGGVLLFTNRTPHQSTPNTTDVIRWSLDLRYQSAALPHNYAPLLEAASVRSGGAGRDASPVACYPPEADFLVRSNRYPERVVQSAAQFRQLREEHAAGPLTRRWEDSP